MGFGRSTQRGLRENDQGIAGLQTLLGGHSRSHLEYVPSRSEDLARVKPIYESLPGWSEDISGARNIADLPENVRKVLGFIEVHTGCPVVLASVGPDREATLELQNPFQC